MTDQRDPRIREAITGLALASRPAPTFEEIVDTRQTAPNRPRRTWMVAVAAAAAVLVIIGAASLILGGSDGSVVPLPPADTTTVPPDLTTTVPATAQVRDAGSAEDAGWTLVNTSADPGVLNPGFLNGSWVILDPGYTSRASDGFYNVRDAWDGSGPAAMADPTEVLWTSTDGVNWTPQEIPAFEGKALDPPWQGTPEELALGGQLWATTTDGEMWATDDGANWYEPEWLGGAKPHPGHLLTWDSTASRSGDTIFLASGKYPLGWVSADAGRSFAPVDAFTGEGTSVVAHWVTNGEFRAILMPNRADQGLTLWRSTDAITWELLGTVTGFQATVRTLEGSGEPLVVLNSSICGLHLARSFDGGLNWQPIEGVSEFLSDRAGALFEYTVTGGCTTLRSGAMHGWMLVQAGPEVAITRNGIDWYFIDGAQLEDWVPAIDGGGFTDEEGNTHPTWWMPPIE